MPKSCVHALNFARNAQGPDATTVIDGVIEQEQVLEQVAIIFSAAAVILSARLLSFRLGATATAKALISFRR